MLYYFQKRYCSQSPCERNRKTLPLMRHLPARLSRARSITSVFVLFSPPHELVVQKLQKGSYR